MRVIPPMTITDALLTSSSITETAPAIWSNATTYAFGDEVSISGTLGLRSVYRSLANANLNNNPTVSPIWWQYRGDVYQTYSTATTYALGERAQDNINHKIYESLVASNLNNPLTDTTRWLLISYTNKWAMFDTIRNTQTITPITQTIVITASVRFDSIALMGMDATKITINVKVAGIDTYNKTITTDQRNTSGWYAYFFNAFYRSPSAAVFDVPPQIGSVLTITIENSQGNVKTGAIILGMNQYIGRVQYGAESDVLNFSSVTRDFAGGTAELIQRRNVPKTIQNIMSPKSLTNNLINIRDDLNAIPAVWSGLDENTNPFFNSLLILGVYKRFTINLAYPEDIMVGLELEEI
jgi:hypothetical protein